ncbi:unnamed protein product [Caenorhabditis angaria]|uniref:Uncharacterized protein n=1 Tax=Caenorhabditis angaria TaxID=860376 RepID=A0A9P1NBY1_9PELO|nr:unnamed protein product [Caenorhabditis angaria]
MSVEQVSNTPISNDSLNRKQQKRRNVSGKQKRISRKMLWDINQIKAFIKRRDKLMLQNIRNQEGKNNFEEIKKRIDGLEEYMQTELRSLPNQGHQMYQFIEVPISIDQMTAAFDVWKNEFFADFREMCEQLRRNIMEDKKTYEEFMGKASRDIMAMGNVIHEIEKVILNSQNYNKNQTKNTEARKTTTIAQTTVNVLRLETVKSESTTESPQFEIVPTEIVPVSMAILVEFEEKMNRVRQDILDVEKRIMNVFREFEDNFIESTRENNHPSTSTLTKKLSHSVGESEQVKSEKYATKLELQDVVNYVAQRISSVQAEQEIKLKDKASKSNLAEVQTTLEMSLKKSQDKNQKRFRVAENQTLNLELYIRRNFPNWNCLQTTIVSMMTMMNRPTLENISTQPTFPNILLENLPGTSSLPMLPPPIIQTPNANNHEEAVNDNSVPDSK